MLLQFSLNSNPQNVSLHHASSLSYSPPHPSKLSTLTSLPQSQSLRFQRLSVTCSVSNTSTERRPVATWMDICRRILFMPNPELGSATVLNQWENEGKTLTKWELGKVVKEMRKRKRHDRALEVCDWMNNREERFSLSASDAAIQVDLISKVRGVTRAEEYFLRLRDVLKDRRTYCALLNVYVRSRLKEKAESLLDTMRRKGYANNSLPFNVMMTLYMNLKEYDKVDMLVSEMIEANIQLDICSYNILLSSCGSQGSIEKMEAVYELMTKDHTIVPNCTTFSTLATVYIKMGHFEKAEEYIRNIESTIKGRDRIPFHCLINLYGNVGKKEEVYRVWNLYKLVFRKVPNLGYLSVISSLVRLGDIDGAENLYEEWLSVKSSYDPRIGNILIGWYAKKGNTDKALGIFKQMTDAGGISYSSTWDVLSKVYIANKSISEALSCLKEAFMADVPKSWRPNPINLSAFFELCRNQDDMESAETLIGLLRQSGFLKQELYASLIGLFDGSVGKGGLSFKIDTVDRTDNIYDTECDDDDSQLVFNQLEGSF